MMMLTTKKISYRDQTSFRSSIPSRFSRTVTNPLFWFGTTGVLIAGMFGVQLWRSISSPALFVSGIENGQVISDNILTLSGNAPKSERLTINGVPTTIDPDGNFKTTLALSSGFHIITMTSENARGRRTTEQFVVTKQQNQGQGAAFSVIRDEGGAPDAVYQN